VHGVDTVREDEVMSASSSDLRPTEPFASDGGPVGVLLSHGFTGSPASMTPWGQDLAARGHTVRVPRLPGHGTTWQQMNRTTWQDWYGALEVELDQLRQRCERVVVGGLSMGGCLALRLAEQRPHDIDAVVVVNPAIASRDPRLRAVPLLKWVVPSLDAIGGDIKKEGVQEHAYDRTPLKALHSMMRMWDDVRANLAAVRAPVLFFRSADDHVVDDSTIQLVREGLRPGLGTFVTLEDSYHVATLDHDAPFIFERSAAFIAEHTGAARG
jgi:carboxylesterase